MASGAELALAMIMTLKDEASGKLKDLGKAAVDADKKAGGLKATFDKLSGVGKTVLLGGIGAAVGAIGGLTAGLMVAGKAAAEEQEGIAKLGAAVSATGADWATAEGAIEAYLDAELKRTALDDGDGREAISRLTTATGDYTKALELMPLAQDLARAKGIDLASASEIVGKVAQGNVGILGRYGITLEKGASATEALGEMQARFGGQAEAWGKTVEGSQQRASIAWGNIKETIGGAVLPVLATFAERSAELAQRIMPMVASAAETLGPILAGIATFVTEAIASFGGLGDVPWEDILPPSLVDTAYAISEALDSISAWWDDKGKPAFDMIAGFVSENIQPIMIGLAAVLASVVVPAFISWAIAAGTAAIATLAAIAPFVALAALVALLAKAWIKDWGGIRTFLTNFYEQSLKPIIQQIIKWFQENIPRAIETVSKFWKETLLPAIRTVVEWIKTDLVPILQKIWDWLATNIPNAIKTVSGFWNDTLLPAIKAVWAFINDPLLPLFKSIVDFMDAAFSLALTALAGLWENVLLPAIQTAANWIKDNVLPVLQDIAKWVNDNVVPALQKFADILNGALKTALTWVHDNLIKPLIVSLEKMPGILDKVTGWFGTMAGKLDALKDKLPAWLTPGSPTPLETGLKGIAETLTKVIPLIEDMADALVSVSEAAPSTENLPGWMAGFKQMIEAMVSMLGSLYDSPKGPRANAINLAKNLAKELSGVVAAISDAADALKSLGTVDFTKLGAKTIDSFITFIHDLLFQIKEEAATWGKSEAEVKAQFALARKLVDQILDLVRIVEPAVAAMAALGDLKVVSDLETKAGYLADALHAFLNKLNYLAGKWANTALETAVKFATAAREVVSVVVPAVEALTAMVEFVVVQDLEAKANDLAAGINTMLNKLNYLALRWKGTALDDAVKFSAAVRDVVGIVQAAVDALAALAEYKPVQGLTAKIEMLLAQLGEVIANLAMEAAAWKSQGWEAAIAFSEAVGKVVGMIKPAIDALAGLAEYKPVQNLTTTLEWFLMQLGDVLAEIAYQAEAWVSQGWEAAIRFSEAVSKIVGMIKPAIDALLALVDYKPSKKMLSAIQNWSLDLYDLIDELIYLAGAFAVEAVEAAAKFATSVGTMVAFIKPALEALGALAKYTAAKGFVKAFMAFRTDLNMALAELLALAQGWDETNLALVEAFAVSVKSVVVSVSTAIETLAKVLGYKGMDARKAMQALETDLNNVLIALGRITNNLSGEPGVGRANAFRIMAEAIAEALNTGLGVFSGLSTGGAGTSAAAALTGFAVAAQQSMADAVAAVKAALRALLSAFASSPLVSVAHGLGQAMGAAIVRGLREKIAASGDILHGVTMTVSGVNWFAGGGDFVARRPQLIGVGEAGPERVTVTPLGQGGRGGEGIVFNYNDYRPSGAPPDPQRMAAQLEWYYQTHRRR